MKKDFIKELAELINKHGLEKEMRDTPDYILAQVCVGAMAVFSEAIARRDEWHGFRKADEKNAKRNDCNICKDRFKCADYIKTQSISSLILEDPDKQNHNVFYFKEFCQDWSKGNKLMHLFGGNRKGDWAQIVEFDYKPNLTQYVGSMMEDARWYEKFMPFAYAWRRNKKNKQNPQGDIAIYDFI